MGLEVLLAVGKPILMLACGTLFFAARVQRPQAHRRLTSRDAILWKTLFGLLIALGAVRYLTRE
jgi:hypothetical protein